MDIQIVAPLNALQTVEPVAADRNPATVYLSSLRSKRSERVMIDALNHVAVVLGYETVELDDPAKKRRKKSDMTYLFVNWSALRFQHTSAIQNKLLETYSAASVNRMMSAVNGVLKAAWKLGLLSVEDYQRAIDYDPAKGVTLPAGRDLSQGELVALVEACKASASAAEAQGKKPDIAWRDAAIIGILYTCGLRRSELAALQMDDYDPETGRLSILHGKGNKQRIVFVKNGTSKALAMWLACRGTAPGALFNPINKSGRIEQKAMTDQAVYNMLKKRGEQAKLKDFSPHDFRRTFVGDLLDRGVGIDTVASLAGHASVDTTRRYDRRPERVKEDAVNKLHFPF